MNYLMKKQGLTQRSGASLSCLAFSTLRLKKKILKLLVDEFNKLFFAEKSSQFFIL